MLQAGSGAIELVEVCAGVRGAVGAGLVRRVDFCEEAVEGVVVVDVVPLREEMDGEVDFGGTVYGFGGDAIGAPGDAVEEVRFGGLEADEVVAAIGGGAEDSAGAGCGELFDGGDEFCRGDSGAVGIDEADGGEAAGEEVLRSGEEAFAETVAALREEVGIFGEYPEEGGFFADRRVGDDDFGGGVGAGEREVGEGVAEKAGVEGGGLMGREGWAEPGFNFSGDRRLGHDGEGASVSEGRAGDWSEDAVGMGGHAAFSQTAHW